MSLGESPVNPKQLRTIIRERLRAAILDGAFEPGEWLRQNRLAKEYGVSAMPVREALKELAADGLVEHVPYRGVRVVRFSPEDVVDLYSFRAFLEGRAANFAAQRISQVELAELGEILDQMRQRMGHPEKLSEYRDLNRRFHRVIIAASRRNYLIRTLNQMWSTFPTMLLGNFAQAATQPLPDRTPRDVDEHAVILDALKRKDADQAEFLLRQHVEKAGQQLLSALLAEN